MSAVSDAFVCRGREHPTVSQATKALNVSQHENSRGRQSDVDA